MKSKKLKGLSRRDFIKIGGAAGSVLAIGGAAGAGLSSGENTDSYTGWERYTHGDGQFFNREPFRVDKAPTIEKVGETRRIERVEQLFFRLGDIYSAMHPRDPKLKKWSKEQGVDALPEPLRTYFKENPKSLEEYFETRKAAKKQREDWDKYKNRFSIADAWSNAHSASMRGFPKRISGSPEENDFRGVNKHKMNFKSPKHASELIKKICHTFGATLVGVCKLNRDWVYQGKLRGVGKTDFDVPKHWKNCIVFATPHEWDALYSNPTYGTSYDGYSRECTIAGKMEVFLKNLGYSARCHVPGNSYDLAVVPIAIDAGLGELGRNNVVITPELGANARLAVVTTDLDMESDKPIDFGVKRFCEKCKICAEECPSNSISFDDEPKTVIRGYKRWNSDHDSCFRIWNTVATSHARGCRVCIAVCPYSRKNNWVHTIARELDPRDPSGLVASALLGMQKNFFDYPGAENYLPEPDGKNITYHEPPDWLKAEEWFDY